MLSLSFIGFVVSIIEPEKFQDFNAKLTDFGLAKESPADRTHLTATRILGTLGYLDPKYYETGVFVILMHSFFMFFPIDANDSADYCQGD